MAGWNRLPFKKHLLGDSVHSHTHLVRLRGWLLGHTLAQVHWQVFLLKLCWGLQEGASLYTHIDRCSCPGSGAVHSLPFAALFGKHTDKSPRPALCRGHRSLDQCLQMERRRESPYFMLTYFYICEEIFCQCYGMPGWFLSVTQVKNNVQHAHLSDMINCLAIQTLSQHSLCYPQMPKQMFFFTAWWKHYIRWLIQLYYSIFLPLFWSVQNVLRTWLKRERIPVTSVFSND